MFPDNEFTYSPLNVFMVVKVVSFASGHPGSVWDAAANKHS